MGIYGALSTAVTGLRAQSFALQNISGNIANSQTTGFKRVDTDFLDLILDQPTKIQTRLGLAQSQATNTQGDVKSVSNSTYMAVNGSGFFVVEPAIGQTDGAAVLGGSSFYTRRGDFDINKNGYLVNGSGYYLKGCRSTGRLATSRARAASDPDSNSFLPAAPTTRINYQLNLPQLPGAGGRESKTAGSEIFRRRTLRRLPTIPRRDDWRRSATGDPSTNIATVGDSIIVKVVLAWPVTGHFTGSGGTAGTNIDLTATTTVGAVLTALNTANPGMTFARCRAARSSRPPRARPTASRLPTTRQVPRQVWPDQRHDRAVHLPDATVERRRPRQSQTPTSSTARRSRRRAITVYAANGAPANIQLRWAKIGSSDVGGTDRGIYYPAARHRSQTMWKSVVHDHSFDAATGALSPAVPDRPHRPDRYGVSWAISASTSVPADHAVQRSQRFAGVTRAARTAIRLASLSQSRSTMTGAWWSRTTTARRSRRRRW